MALSQEAICRTALRILSQFGMGDLSMRRLARELDVQPSALYWHVSSKQELFTLLAGQMLAAAEAEAASDSAPAPPGPADAAWALRTVLLRYRDGAEIYALGYALDAPALTPAPIRALDADGQDSGEMLMQFVLGSLLIEQHRSELAAADPEAGARFRGGVNRLIGRP